MLVSDMLVEFLVRCMVRCCCGFSVFGVCIVWFVCVLISVV